MNLNLRRVSDNHSTQACKTQLYAYIYIKENPCSSSLDSSMKHTLENM